MSPDRDDSMVRTYDEVAAWLPADIVEAIEVSLPCSKSANRQHMWDVWAPEIEVWGTRTSISAPPVWSCIHCGVHTITDPGLPPSTWDVVTADEILKEWAS